MRSGLGLLDDAASGTEPVSEGRSSRHAGVNLSFPLTQQHR